MKYLRKAFYDILLAYLSVAVVFLGFRILFKLLTVNTSVITIFVYGLTDLMLFPFFGILRSKGVNENSVFDLEAFIALAFYLIAIPLIMLLARLFTGTIHEVKKATEEEDLTKTA